MAKTEIDKLDWIIRLILTVIPATGFIVQGINRMLRGRIIIGIIWLISGGIFGIGWIIDIFTMLVKKDITFLA